MKIVRLVLLTTFPACCFSWSVHSAEQSDYIRDFQSNTEQSVDYEYVDSNGKSLTENITEILETLFNKELREQKAITEEPSMTRSQDHNSNSLVESVTDSIDRTPDMDGIDADRNLSKQFELNIVIPYVINLSTDPNVEYNGKRMSENVEALLEVRKDFLLEWVDPFVSSQSSAYQEDIGSLTALHTLSVERDLSYSKNLVDAHRTLAGWSRISPERSPSNWDASCSIANLGRPKKNSLNNVETLLTGHCSTEVTEDSETVVWSARITILNSTGEVGTRTFTSTGSTSVSWNEVFEVSCAQSDDVWSVQAIFSMRASKKPDSRTITQFWWHSKQLTSSSGASIECEDE